MSADPVSSLREVAELGVSAAQAAQSIPISALMVFPVLFAAGRSLVDSTDGVMMLGAYDGAFVGPMRKLPYNVRITPASVVVAVFIGGIQALGLLGDQLGMDEEGFWGLIGAPKENVDNLGFAITGLANGLDVVEVRTATRA